MGSSPATSAIKLKNMIYKRIFIGCVTIIGIFAIFGSPIKPNPVVLTNPITTITETRDSLTEWQVFIMALVEVECERNPKVKSSKNAIGPFQITKIYVDEVNNLYNTNFVLEDAWDLDKALTMFEMMNDHYNPTRDIDRAIKLHNPGAGKWYEKRIKDRMELIRFSEALRSKIVELYDN